MPALYSKDNCISFNYKFQLCSKLRVHKVISSELPPLFNPYKWLSEPKRHYYLHFKGMALGREKNTQNSPRPKMNRNTSNTHKLHGLGQNT